MAICWCCLPDLQFGSVSQDLVTYALLRWNDGYFNARPMITSQNFISHKCKENLITGWIRLLKWGI